MAAPSALANCSSVSDKQLVEEVHAYTMQQLAKCRRTEEMSLWHPGKLEEQVRRLVQSWCTSQLGMSNHGCPCEVKSNMAKPHPSKLMTSQQVFDKVLDDVISRGVPEKPSTMESKPQKPGSSKRLTTKQIQKMVNDQIMSESIGGEPPRQRSGSADEQWRGKNHFSKERPDESAGCVPHTTTCFHGQPEKEHWTARVCRCIFARPKPPRMSSLETSE